MRNRHRLAAGVAALLLLLAPAAPASAAVNSSDSADPFTYGTGTTITGEPWSAPAMPVDCTGYGDPIVKVTCDPIDLGAQKEPRCFSGVGVGGASATVCTTTDAIVEAIGADRGVEISLTFRCTALDAACLFSEQGARAMAQSATGMVAMALDMVSLSTDSFLFAAALDEWSWWQGTVLLVILGAGAIGITQAAMSGRRDEVINAVIRFVIAVPVSQLALVGTGLLLDIIDGASMAILVRNGEANAAGAGLYGAFENIIFSAGGGNFLFAQTVIVLLLIAAVVLVVVFSLRNLAVLILVAVAPVAFMLLPIKGIGVQWIIRWASAVVAMLLTTPLTLGLVMLVLRGLGSAPTLWSLDAIPLAIGLILIGFAPMAVFGMFSFIGGHAAASLADSSGGGASRSVQQITRSAGNRVRSIFSRRPGGGGSRPSGPRPAPRSPRPQATPSAPPSPQSPPAPRPTP